MSELNIKLCAFDMDGTILTSDNNLTQNTINSLKKIQDRGIHIAFVTGRVYISPLYYKKINDLKASILCTNGSLVYDEKDELIYKRILDKEEMHKILALLEEERLYFHLYTIDGLVTPYGDNPNSSVERRMPKGYDHLLKRHILTFDEIRSFDEDLFKILIIENDETKRNNFKNKLIDRGIKITSSWWNNIEYTHQLADKKIAIQKLLDHYNLNWDNVIAFGDNENDLVMLKAAKKGYLMGNASENLKKDNSLEIVDTNDNEGVNKKLIEIFKL